MYRYRRKEVLILVKRLYIPKSIDRIEYCKDVYSKTKKKLEKFLGEEICIKEPKIKEEGIWPCASENAIYIPSWVYSKYIIARESVNYILSNITKNYKYPLELLFYEKYVSLLTFAIYNIDKIFNVKINRRNLRTIFRYLKSNLQIPYSLIRNVEKDYEKIREIEAQISFYLN
jgi:hypothetical protein